MARKAVFSLVSALILASAAFAASNPWTASSVRSELVAPSAAITMAGAWPSGTSTFSTPPLYSRGIAQSATCRGLGKPSGESYAVFSCATVWALTYKPGTTQQTTIWMRPWSATSICESPISIGACPPAAPAHPLRGDPRVCAESDYVHCIVGAASAAAGAKLRAENLIGVNYGCQATTAFVYRCAGAGAGTNPATALTVTFLPGKTSWTTNVSAVQ